MTFLNIIVSGASVSGDVTTTATRITLDLGNSDKVGKLTFALQNASGTYSAYLFSGDATAQVDVMNGNNFVKTIFRGTLEAQTNQVNAQTGSETIFLGYDFAQELLGLITPDGRQKSLVGGLLVSGDQGMSSQIGMDLVPFVSGVIGSGSAGSIVSGAQLNLFMGQYFGKSGDTTGSNSGLSFSFKPYLSGSIIWGTNPFYKTWYVQDGASDTNANYWIPYDTLKVKHEYAWDVLRKLCRQGFVVDRSGFKSQFEAYVDVSGGINLLTSGSSKFIASGVTLVYYVAGASGSANNNVIDMQIPYSTESLKDMIVGWFPTWTTYPLDSDAFSDLVAYSGSYWSGAFINGAVAISGNTPAPGNTAGFISIMARNTGNNNTNGGVDLIYTLWSGITLNVKRWNVSGGNGVTLNYQAQYSTDANSLPPVTGPRRSVAIYDNAGNFIVKSGQGPGPNDVNITTVLQSGWSSYTDTIYNPDGTFNSGTGTNGGWAQSAATDLTQVKQLKFGFGTTGNAPTVYAILIDNVNFQFSYNFNPVIAFNSGAQSVYGRRYETFEFPYQTTDSGAGSIVLAELQSKMLSRQIGQFTIHDNFNSNPVGAQFNIQPGQIFIVDAPTQACGSGQFFFYWRATEVQHQWQKSQGLRTVIRAYPWFSGATTLSGVNFISYSLPLPAPIPRPAQQMPISHWAYPQPGR